MNPTTSRTHQRRSVGDCAPICLCLYIGHQLDIVELLYLKLLILLALPRGDCGQFQKCR
jgi:hypothetical protein